MSWLMVLLIFARDLHGSFYGEGDFESLHHKELTVHAAHEGRQGLYTSLYCGVQPGRREEQEHPEEVWTHENWTSLWVKI